MCEEKIENEEGEKERGWEGALEENEKRENG